MAHITGGGIPENLPRCLNQNQSVQLKADSWSIPPIFPWLASAGNVEPTAMWETFNMGIGFVVLVSPQQAEATLNWFQSQGISAYQIGEVVTGKGEVLVK